MNRLLFLINAVLTLSILALGVDLGAAWYRGGARVAPGVETGAPVPGPAAPVTVPRQERRIDTRMVVEKDIFQTAPATNEMSIHEIEDLPPTRLRLQLRGTAIGIHDAKFAMIADESADVEGVCREGDFVAGVQVRRILRDRVILDVNGQPEVLALTEFDEPEAAISANDAGHRPAVTHPEEKSGKRVAPAWPGRRLKPPGGSTKRPARGEPAP